MGVLRLAARVLIAALLVAALTGAADAERRVALVIGNSSYTATSPLANPASDAELMARTLKASGFEVTKIIDADQRAMKQAMLDFGRKLRDGTDASLFFYAGHGVQANGANYLIPVDAVIHDESELDLQAVDVNAFLRVMQNSASRANIVVLDACRNNPFASAFRSGSRGLAMVDAPRGTYIAYSTAPGEVAEDGSGNSPYTLALTTAMARPGVKLEETFKEARRLVLAATGDRQVPWETSSLTGDFYFSGSPDPVVGTEPVVPDRVPAVSAELTFWNSIVNSKDKADFEAYLRHYPAGAFADLAHNRLASLTPPKEPSPAPKPIPPEAAIGLRSLAAAAKREGALNVIALPRDWCGYGAVIEGFKAKYGLEVNELNPDAGSGDEIEAIRANKGQKGSQVPDVVDVGLSFGPSAKAEGLLQPYKVGTWDSIPEELKDSDGYWYGGYYGVIAFEVNTDRVKNVPRDWPDLLKSEYKSSVALAGDPRVANQAIQSVFAAGLSAAGGDVNGAAEAGLTFFAELRKRGNLVPVVGRTTSLVEGTTPIILRWDFHALADRAALKGHPGIEVVIPSSGALAGAYVQAISAYAVHPNAAKLWMEYLYSDAGQIGWLKGLCHPVRYTALAAAGAIPERLSDAMPAADLYSAVTFPSLESLDAAKATITERWDAEVGEDVR